MRHTSMLPGLCTELTGRDFEIPAFPPNSSTNSYRLNQLFFNEQEILLDNLAFWSSGMMYLSELGKWGYPAVPPPFT